MPLRKFATVFRRSTRHRSKRSTTFLFTSDDNLESQLQTNQAQLTLLGAELDRQRGAYTSRATASNSRAAILIGTASIGAGFQLTSTTSTWQIASISMTVLAALCGVVAMWPRRGDELNIEPMVDAMYTFGPRQTEWNLLNHKLHVHKLDELALRRRRWWLSAGFTVLALSIALTGLRLAEAPASLPATPTPIPSRLHVQGGEK